MKKKILLTLAIVAMLVCLFAISVSADTVVSSTSDAYGTLCQFDEAIGNTQISDKKDDGTVARTVLTDGNGNYYTVPTVYVLTEHHKNRGNGVEGEMFNLSFGEISAKLGFSVSKNSIIRIEFPSDIKFICSNNENLSGCANMVECIMNDGVYFWDNGQRKAFTNCKKLKSIDLSGMIIDQSQGTYSLLEYCDELEYVKLPNAYLQADGTYMDYATNYMFHGCKKLKTIDNMEGFFKGDKTLNYRTFSDCYVLEKIVLPQGLEKIEGRAIGNCKAITSIVIPDTVTEIGTTETVFESCTSLKKVILPNGPVSLGAYCFEKCTALEAVWMPSQPSTFDKQIFGQCGAGLKVTFYFTTATNNITINNSENNKDPFITAINAENDERIKYNTPIETKCVVFFGNHTYDINTVADLVYTSFLTNGTYYYSCPTCDGYAEATPSALPLFSCQGISASKVGNGISVGFKVDSAAIENYTKVTGNTVKYGVFAVAQEKLKDNDIFDEQGNAFDGAVTVEIKRMDFAGFDIKVMGFETDAQKATKLALGAYAMVSNGEGVEYSYMQSENPLEGEKYSFVTYNEAVAN
ncbi:MAG: leucine-rich repeat domain-containing protein [Clostridia bacterium]|nr:leucine-rich repeat domain-containing protein [Clostridia bacterium]